MACECGHSKADHTRYPHFDPHFDGMTACRKCECCEYAFQPSEAAEAADALYAHTCREPTPPPLAVFVRMEMEMEMEMATNIMPAEVFSLGSYLWEEMQARGWTTDDVAARMGDADANGYAVNLGTVAMLMSVQKDSCLLDEITNSKLAHAFSVSEELFRNLDNTWRKWPARRVPFECPDEAYGPKTVAALRLTPSTPITPVPTGR